MNQTDFNCIKQKESGYTIHRFINQKKINAKQTFESTGSPYTASSLATAVNWLLMRDLSPGRTVFICWTRI
jgi:hypothetical protein